MIINMQNLQIDFFNALKSALPDYQNLAQSVAEVLSISINEAYKKIRGNSALSLEQAVQLADHFNTPFYISLTS